MVFGLKACQKARVVRFAELAQPGEDAAPGQLAMAGDTDRDAVWNEGGAGHEFSLARFVAGSGAPS